MVSKPIMNTIQKAATQNIGLGLKDSSLHRTHYSAPSGGGYHQHHHLYHVPDSEQYGHSYSDHGGGKKRSIALSALTLLAFLFFLNILQNCLDDQMDDLNPQVIIMSSRLQKLKEAQKRLVDTKLDAVSAETMKNGEVNYEKLHRTIDKMSNSKSFANTSLKLITNKNGGNRRPYNNNN